MYSTSQKFGHIFPCVHTNTHTHLHAHTHKQNTGWQSITLFTSRTVPVKSLDTFSHSMCPNFWLVLYIHCANWVLHDRQCIFLRHSNMYSVWVKDNPVFSCHIVERRMLHVRLQVIYQYARSSTMLGLTVGEPVDFSITLILFYGT